MKTKVEAKNGVGNWELKDAKAWADAAEALVADGYTQRGRVGMYPATFHKAGHPTLVLVRSLGVLNWHPTEY